MARIEVHFLGNLVKIEVDKAACRLAYPPEGRKYGDLLEVNVRGNGMEHVVGWFDNNERGQKEAARFRVLWQDIINGRYDNIRTVIQVNGRYVILYKRGTRQEERDVHETQRNLEAER